MMFFQKRYLFFQTYILRFQKYEYYGVDKTEVYWIHFTGSDVKNILRKYGFSDKQRVFPVGTLLEHEMSAAAACFHENYNRDINIEEYAASRDMSVSWFIRNFKKYTGSTPMQFIVSLRISNAQILLETTKSPTTSSTGGLILALQRAILLLAPQGGVTSTFTGPL